MAWRAFWAASRRRVRHITGPLAWSRRGRWTHACADGVRLWAFTCPYHRSSGAMRRLALPAGSDVSEEEEEEEEEDDDDDDERAH